MRWRGAVNVALSRTVGYKVVRAGGTPKPKPTPKPKGGLPRYYDAETRETIRAVRPRTMTSHGKLFALIVATRYIVDHRIPGAIVECGVWRGGSMQAIAKTLL